MFAAAATVPSVAAHRPSLGGRAARLGVAALLVVDPLVGGSNGVGYGRARRRRRVADGRGEREALNPVRLRLLLAVAAVGRAATSPAFCVSTGEDISGCS